MKFRSLISLLLFFVFVMQPIASAAMETDQYNLPSVPLADIGDEVSKYVEDNLRTALARINSEIGRHQACLEAAHANKSYCADAETEHVELAYLRSNDAVAKELFKLLGGGNIFVSKIGKWINSHEFQASPSRYKTSYLHSIYVAAPLDYATVSPTVRLFGVELGTDKLDHFFQQGYKYYKIQREAVAQGSTAEQATTKAIKWGQKTERTYFGLLVSGVYSNADLFANYAGMKFYQGLTKTISTGNHTLPTPVVLKNGVWNVDDIALRENLLKPFLSDHLNEALNPSGYAFTIFRSVRRAVEKHSCPDWRSSLPNTTKANLESRSASLEKWNGEDYGFTRKGRSISIATCFGD
ncbi:MAG: hypothetical protein ACKVRN_01650 [Pyrinomonadaceae bacterium]